MSLPRLFLELLEPRIAPATIIAGPLSLNGVPIAGTVTYNSPGTPFKDASSVLTNDGSLTGFVDGSNYYLQLKAGDILQMYTAGTGYFIQVNKGVVDAFFLDHNQGTTGDYANVPTASDLVGLSVSAGANLSVSGVVGGDIIANLDAKTGAIEVNNLISNKQNIASLTVGNVFGSIIAGGGVTTLLKAGTVDNVESGISADTSYSFGGSSTVGEGILTQFSANPTYGSGFLPAAKQPGANLNNLQINTLFYDPNTHYTGQIIAGGGGAGAVGGSITNVTLNSDTTGVVIHAGAGGAGEVPTTGSSILTGGAGGKVSQVVVYSSSISDTSDNSTIDIFGGTGGNALAGSTGTGGNGGLVSNVWVGYQPNLGKTTYSPAPNWLHDDILIQGGDGGSGATAGSGGAVNNTTLLTSTPDLLGHDITLQGGDGGALFAAGKKAGAGGSVTTFNIQDLLDNASSAGASTVYVAGGNASDSSALTSLNCVGAVGGSVTNTASPLGSLIGKTFDFVGGNGSSGTATGGAGGSVSNVSFGSYDTEYLENLSVTTGTGGSSTTGNGGAGGSISGIVGSDTSLNTMNLTIGHGGQAGSVLSGVGGIGGAGGSIKSIYIQADNSLDANFAHLTPTAGAGGNGFKGGGVGGSIQNFNFFIPKPNTSAHASLTATAGAGGSVLGTHGNGGVGGSLSAISLRAKVLDGTTGGLADNQFADLIAGAGGNGAGSGTAGAGGSITLTDTQVIDNVTFTAGSGGNSGTKGKMGAGGSIGSLTQTNGIFAESTAGSIAYYAGDAGSVATGVPSLGAAGGSINNAVAQAAANLTFHSGNGAYGGNGGDINKIGFVGAAANTMPVGNISVIAGNGGNAISLTTASGRGGNVNASGYTSSDASNTAIFQAGDGGGGFGNAAPLGKTGGAGGSFTALNIFGGAVSFSVVAGQGGNGTTTGGVGGSVSNINLVPNPTTSTSGGTTIANPNLYAVAAGDGGNVTTGSKGALGGSVSAVHLAGNIGVMTGEHYGFDATGGGNAMGGIFAGTGGAGVKSSGLAGNVSAITAQAISAIVAGRTLSSPQLVNQVDNVNLNGLDPVTVNTNGSFANFPTASTYDANVVGGKFGDPTVANAVNFQTSTGALTPSGSGSLPWTLGTTTPIDGLIAALTLTANRNFTPLALLTTDPGQPSGYGLYLPPPVSAIVTS